jgi:hypothetical protein
MVEVLVHFKSDVILEPRIAELTSEVHALHVLLIRQISSVVERETAHRQVTLEPEGLGTQKLTLPRVFLASMWFQMREIHQPGIALGTLCVPSQAVLLKGGGRALNNTAQIARMPMCSILVCLQGLGRLEPRVAVGACDEQLGDIHRG